ncbi:MAG: tRNA 2-selenouridine(34) synthase MnmH [Lentimicrobium sp.]
MVLPIIASEVIELKGKLPLIDVRSPLEFSRGHIPGAVNIPLFSDQERAEVGTRYQQAGKDAALFVGLDFVGVKMSGFVKRLNAISRGKAKEVSLYCWRGGMRSASMAWLFSTAGYKVHLLEGGYKAYRTYIRAEAGNGSPVIVLGGMTGSGKTEVLYELKKHGEQIIDLELLAHNKGSVFGYLGQQPQPTNEQFENDLYEEWSKLDKSRPVWLEDESRSIGAVGIPGPFFEQMKLHPMVLLNVPLEARVDRLVKEYAGFDKSLLADALMKIAQPLGGQGFAEAVSAILDGRFAPAITQVLVYYDKMYRKALHKFDNRTIFEIETDSGDARANAEKIMNFIGRIKVL